MSKTLPDWGAWVTHYDSTGQVATMASTFNSGNTMLSLLFDRMVISLQGNAAADKLAGSAVLAGHYPIALPDEFPLAGFHLMARGVVAASHDASATLTLSLGDAARAVEWPRRSRVIDAGSGKELDPIEKRDFIVSCFAGEAHLATGDPPKFPPQPPLSLAIGMHARRTSVEGTLEFHLDSVDIVILRDN